MRKRVSSRVTYLFKYIFPLIGLCVFISVVVQIYYYQSNWFYIPGHVWSPLIFSVVWTSFFVLIHWNVVDSAFEESGYLIVRNFGRERRISFSEITDIEFKSYSKQKEVVFQFLENGETKKLVFLGIPKFSFRSPNENIEELVSRIKAARVD